jgi:hypothetical protein
MTPEDRERLGKVLQGRMSIEEFETILRRSVKEEIAKLRAKVNRDAEREGKNV